MTPVLAANLADRAGSLGLDCWAEGAEVAGADGVVVGMARGRVDGTEAEAYLVRTGSDDPPGTEVAAVFLHPDCRRVELP